ncbi:MAG: HEAT repeat domain-containing protein [Isosphaeraceae bacterium]|nr:HEAT repeat domain-containing protein [Isosphaeraceae bacterium]
MSIAMSALWIALMQTGLGGCGHPPVRGAVVVDSCAVCDLEAVKVANAIHCLQTAREWRRRDNAAHELAKYGPRRHPELIDALALALLKDPHEEVREEAAETLRKHGVRTPFAHYALTRAAKCDRDHATRKQAAKALRDHKGRCLEACRVCTPNAIVLGPAIETSPPRFSTPVEPPLEQGIPYGEPELEPLPEPLPPPPAPGLGDDDVPPPPRPSLRPSLPPLIGPAARNATPGRVRVSVAGLRG